MGRSIQELEGKKVGRKVKHIGKELSVKEWRDMTPDERDNHLLSYYSREYKEEYNGELIEHMSTGRSYETFCAKIECDISILYQWEERIPSWYNAKKIAFHKCLEYWENILINATSDKIKSNATLLIFKMKNSFPELYSDMQHVEHSGNVVFNFETGITRTPRTIETDDYKVLSDEADLL